MKKIVFTIGTRRLEVDLEDDFAQYVSNDFLKNEIALDRDNDVSRLLQLYLKTIHKEFQAEEQIKILLNQIESSN
ncbi:MAG TPA: hypothetical protein EYG94_08665 [Campylobacterales bacterium]|nr:hypothetical protein [Campylobacterales bacterium]